MANDQSEQKNVPRWRNPLKTHCFSSLKDSLGKWRTSLTQQQHTTQTGKQFPFWPASRCLTEGRVSSANWDQLENSDMRTLGALLALIHHYQHEEHSFEKTLYTKGLSHITPTETCLEHK